MILRKTKEADRQANIGLELDPMKPLILGLYGNVLWHNNDDRQGAIKVYEKSLSIDPNFGLGNRDLYEVQMEHAYKNGAYEKWIEFWNKKVENLGSWNIKGREAVLKSFDERGHIAAIEEMIRMNEIYGKDCYLSEGVKAERYIMLGNMDKAMESLEKGYEKRWFLMPYISPKYHYYEQLKDEPRYVEILKKMDLPH